MRGRCWLLIGNLGLGSCLLAGCLHSARPTQLRRSLPEAASTPAASTVAETEKPVSPSSDYLVSRTPAVQPGLLAAQTTEKTGENPVEKTPAKQVEPVEMRIPSEGPPPPSPPKQIGKENETLHMEIHPAPFARPEAPAVQALRSLLDHRPEEEINEQLKPYDAATREVMFLLLTSIAQLEQSGGITQISPRDLAAWTNRLNTLTASLRSRSQLILERMCFCSHINNFGDFAPLPPEHIFFYPGELAHVYVQARNLSNRRQGDKYVTVLKARLEIYDENSRERPPIIWNSLPREDISASPRQDYYINFRFQIPPSCPAGLYTLRITVEDWTDATSQAKQVPEWRTARCTLDFRVGGPIAHPAPTPIVDAASP